MKQLKILIHRLFIVESYQNKDFQHLIIRKTALRGIPFVTVIMFVELCLIMVSLFIPTAFYDGYTSFFRLHYIVLFIVTLLSLFLLRHFLHFYQTNDLPLYIIITCFVIFSIMWSASISFVDQKFSADISVYLTFIILLGIGTLFTPRRLLIIYLLLHGFFLIGSLHSQENPKLLFNILLNSTLFTLFAWVMSRQFYLESYHLFLKDKLIEEQTKHLKENNEHLTLISQIDALTKLFNRYSLNNMLNSLWFQAHQHQQTFSVLMIDIDHFKLLNDQYGHIAGDKCLQVIGSILAEYTSRLNSHAFRFGGDEFCLIFIDHEIEEIKQLVHEIKQIISEQTITTDHQLKLPTITLSIGFYSSQPQKNLSPWTFIDLADKDLYQQKGLKAISQLRKS